ncbi:MAG: 2Fe-2S iron-sulfur cluster-binding protein, partial [Xanthobacteraceae bacterium]
MPPNAAASVGSREIEVEVLRYRSDTDSRPVPQAYRVPFTYDMSVLQGLQYIKDHLDGTLSFRWSCRMAICGSCGMMIGAEPKLACMTLLRDYHPGPLRIEPLTHFP